MSEAPGSTEDNIMKWSFVSGFNKNNQSDATPAFEAAAYLRLLI